MFIKFKATERWLVLSGVLKPGLKFKMSLPLIFLFRGLDFVCLVVYFVDFLLVGCWETFFLTSLIYLFIKNTVKTEAEELQRIPSWIWYNKSCWYFLYLQKAALLSMKEMQWSFTWLSSGQAKCVLVNQIWEGLCQEKQLAENGYYHTIIPISNLQKRKLEHLLGIVFFVSFRIVLENAKFVLAKLWKLY